MDLLTLEVVNICSLNATLTSSKWKTRPKSEDTVCSKSCFINETDKRIFVCTHFSFASTHCAFNNIVLYGFVYESLSVFKLHITSDFMAHIKYENEAWLGYAVTRFHNGWHCSKVPSPSLIKQSFQFFTSVFRGGLRWSGPRLFFVWQMLFYQEQELIFSSSFVFDYH